MHKIRKAHSLELIERRLKVSELSDADAMELVSLQDELARVERKWREQIAQGSERRQPNDVPRLNEYFDRLQKQIDAALRRPNLQPMEKQLLAAALASIAGRSRT